MNVFEALHDDLEGRDAIGWALNRKPLLANEPGRDWLQEAYEEALDQAVYLKAALMQQASGQGPVPGARGSVAGAVFSVAAGGICAVLVFALGYLVGGGF